MNYTRTEYMCSVCGKRVAMKTSLGRPRPGECPRQSKMADEKNDHIHGE